MGHQHTRLLTPTYPTALGLPYAIDTPTLGSFESSFKTPSNELWLIGIKWLKSKVFLIFRIPFQSQFLGLPYAIDTPTLGSSESSVKTL